MRDTNWWKKAIIYELYVDKFAGNFKNLISKLDYFVALGVNTLWILPHYPSLLVDGGYDISDYKNIRPDLGTMEDFDIFLASAHEKGLKVIIDLVLNHTSIDHPWFIESRSSKNNPKRDWYLWSDNQAKFSMAYVHFSVQKGSNWIPDPQTGDYYYATFYKEQPDLNWDNPEVVEAMYSVVDFWLQKGIDGFRLDAVSRLSKREGTYCFGIPETHQILKNLRSYIDNHYSNIVLLAETGGWPNEAIPFFGSGDECHLVMHFPLAVRMLRAVINKNPQIASDVWNWTGQIPDNCSWAAFLTSHDSVDLFFLEFEDEKKQMSSHIDPKGTFSQPDGQSMGARLGEVCHGNKEDILWATKLQLDQPAVPIIYYGNEMGMRNLSLPEKPNDIREFVRGSFDWNQAEIQSSDPNSVLNFVRGLIHSKKSL